MHPSNANKRKIFVSLLTGVLLLGAGIPFASQAATYNFTDAAAEVTVNERNGLTVWRTDGGRDNIFIGNYYLRRLGDAEELPLSEFIDTPSATRTDNSVSLAFSDDRLSARLDTMLTGGPAGSSRSSLTRRLTLKNTGQVTQSLVVFDYLDLDIRFDQLAQADQSVQTSPGRIMTRSASFPLAIETRVSPAPDQWEITDFFTLYTRFFLDQDGPTTLPNTPAIGEPFPLTPGDNAFAFGWTVDLEAGERFRVENVSRIAPIPIVPAGLLLTSGLGAFWIIWRRRKHFAGEVCDRILAGNSFADNEGQSR